MSKCFVRVNILWKSKFILYSVSNDNIWYFIAMNFPMLVPYIKDSIMNIKTSIPKKHWQHLLRVIIQGLRDLQWENPR